jgi:hypothetical protein
MVARRRKFWKSKKLRARPSCQPVVPTGTMVAQMTVTEGGNLRGPSAGPRWLEARVLLNYVLLQEGTDPAAAERALAAVLALDPGNAEARHNRDLRRRKAAQPA